MFSSKSTSLIAHAKRHKLGKQRCLIIKFAGDDRYTNTAEIVTHDLVTLRGSLECNRLSEVPEHEIQNADAIFIDEGQFFPDLALADQWANDGKKVVVAGLDGDYRREPFPQMCALVAKADYVTKLNSVCSMCGQDGSFTRRLVDSDQLQLIGGSTLYDARCRHCFHL